VHKLRLSVYGSDVFSRFLSISTIAGVTAKINRAKIAVNENSGTAGVCEGSAVAELVGVAVVVDVVDDDVGTVVSALVGVGLAVEVGVGVVSGAKVAEIVVAPLTFWIGQELTAPTEVPFTKTSAMW
jgi:hypothetical protein